MKTPHILSASDKRTRQHGFSLIEIMVGIVIGMIAVLVIYQVFAAAEGIKRNTTSAGDAQQNGLLASFMLGVELSNASNGVAMAWQKLQSCPTTVSAATTLRPIPILITDGGGPTVADKFVVNYSISNIAIAPAPFKAASGSNAPYVVHAPIGFRVGDIVVAISPGAPGTGTCAISSVTAVSAPSAGPPDESAGQVTIAHTNAPVAFTDDAFLLNMGAPSNVQRVLYDVDANGVLHSTSLWDAVGAPVSQPPNPLASNIVNMKLLYGIDNNGDGVLDTWVAPTGAWSDASVLAADAPTLRKIKAVRLGIIVRGEQWDRDAPDVTARLFDDAIPFSQTFVASGGNYRYRWYETIIPLRNPVWN
ncbi:MAG TPA: PilW family protein [Casimicrobiaceae bacterium]|jgi:type IV pilus assembly protein PilW